MAQPCELRRYHVPKSPVINVTAIDPLQVARDWTAPILIVEKASMALAEDIRLFLEYGLQLRQTDNTRAFVHSVSFQEKVLLEQPLQQLEDGLRDHHTIQSSTSKAQPMGELLELARGAMLALQLTEFNLRSAIQKAEWAFQWSMLKPDEPVPTAPPYELLYQCLCDDLSISQQETSNDRDILLSLRERRLFKLDNRTISRPHAPDGQPSMIFACRHRTTIHQTLLLGTNEQQWGAFEAISTATRYARDTRLQSYIPLADAAYNALQRKEARLQHEVNAMRSMEGVKTEKLLWEARRRAITEMRDDPSFLGGMEEMGLALRIPEWEANQPCYLCRGMMGYQLAREWSEKQKAKYIVRFDWKLRDGYAHSCAEAAVRLQCMYLNVLDGKAAKK